MDFQLSGGGVEAADLAEGDVAAGGGEWRGEFADADVAVFDFRAFELEGDVAGGKRLHFVVGEAEQAAADFSIDQVDGGLGAVDDGLDAVPAFKSVVNGVAPDVVVVLLVAEQRRASGLGKQAGFTLAGEVVRIWMHPGESADFEEDKVGGVTFLDLAFHGDGPDAPCAFVRIGDVIKQPGIAEHFLARFEFLGTPGVFEIEVEARVAAIGDDHAEVPALVLRGIGIHVDDAVADDDVAIGVSANGGFLDGDTPAVEIAAVEEGFPRDFLTVECGSGENCENGGGFHDEVMA